MKIHDCYKARVLPPKYPAWKFKKYTGRWPMRNELELTRCQLAGNMGHWYCGSRCIDDAAYNHKHQEVHSV